MKFMQCIALGRRDAILKKWCSMIVEQDDDKLSYMIKQALTIYIRDNVYIEIGRIHFNHEMDEMKDYKKNSITFGINDAPELIEWIEEVNKVRGRKSKYIRNILMNCITIIPDNEEEYIPSYYDVLNFTLNKQNNVKKVSLSNHSSEVLLSENNIHKVSSDAIEETKKELKLDEKKPTGSNTKPKKSNYIDMLGLSPKQG